MFIALFCFALGIGFILTSEDDGSVGFYNFPTFAPWKYKLIGVFMFGVGIYHLIYSVDW